MSFSILTAASGNTTASLLTTLLPFVVLIVVFYFLLIRPENKKKKALSEMRDSLSVGDEVTTIGGIVGKVCPHQGRSGDHRDQRGSRSHPVHPLGYFH